MCLKILVFPNYFEIQEPQPPPQLIVYIYFSYWCNCCYQCNFYNYRRRVENPWACYPKHFWVIKHGYLFKLYYSDNLFNVLNSVGEIHWMWLQQARMKIGSAAVGPAARVQCTCPFYSGTPFYSEIEH